MPLIAFRRILLAALTLPLLGMAQPETPDASPKSHPGDDLFALGRFDDAKRIYEDAIIQNSQSAPALARLARARLYENRLTEAMDIARRALDLDPNDPIAGATLKMAEIRQRNFGLEFYQFSQPAKPVTLPFVVTDPLPVVRASINGRAATFLVDTGAPNIMLRRKLADNVGLKVSEGGLGVFAGGLKARVDQAVVQEIALGQLTIRHVPAQIIPDAAALSLPGIEIDGIIGAGLLQQFLSTIDYCDGQLVLAPRSESAVFQQRMSSSGGNVVPIFLVGDHFIFARGAINSLDGMLFIDTGLAGGGILAPRETLAAAGIAFDEANPLTGQGGGGAVQFVTFKASATLGDLKREDVPGIHTIGGANILAGFPFRAIGILSHAFFRESRLTFDFDAMKLVTEQCRA